MAAVETLNCPHAKRCGGCTSVGVPYAEQLARKHASVQTAFARFPGHSSLSVASVERATPVLGYRTRAKLVCGEHGELGLYERDSHLVVDIPECQVLAPALARAAAAARRVLSANHVVLDGIDLRLVDAGVQVTLIAARITPEPALQDFGEALAAECFEVCSVAASFREAGAKTLLGTGHVVLRGDPVARHHLQADGPYHLAAHGAFTQAHVGQANAAHAAIERALRAGGAKRVLELYAGSGALSLRLASAGFAMTAVEAFAPALDHAAQAAREQQLTLATLTSSAERALLELARRPKAFDALIVNPPRRGLSLEVRRLAATLAPERIIYMSCDAETLARDLDHFALLGYGAKTVLPLDMIPHSDAVECLVTLVHGEAAALSPLLETASLIAAGKSAYEAVTGSGSLLARVRRLPGAEKATPLAGQACDDDTSGVCLFARDEASLGTLQQAFQDGTRNFVGLTRGVTHKRGRIQRPVREARRVVSASTRYVRDSVRAGHSLLTIWPERASPLHLRQLLASVGHPILGDARFGDAASNGYYEHKHGLDRSFLHCSSVTLALPSGPLTIEAALTGELSAVLARAGQEAAVKGG